MKRYTRPNVEITMFAVEDIITASGTNGAIVNSGTFTGANADMYDVYKANSSADNGNVAVFTW